VNGGARIVVQCINATITDNGTWWLFQGGSGSNGTLMTILGSTTPSNGDEFYVEFSVGGSNGASGSSGTSGSSGSSGTSGSSGSSGTSGVATITNLGDNRVLTSTGTQGEANAEQKLQFNGTVLSVNSSNNDAYGIRVFGGVQGSATPYITPEGHTDIFFGNAATGFALDMRRNKLAFDSDATNTFIQADSATPENLEIHADGDIELNADNDIVVPNMTTGTSNDVVVKTTNNELRTDTIDSRVWGTSLVDGANGANNRVATFSDANSLNGEANLTFDGTTLTVTGNASITGNTTIGNASGDSVTLNAGAVDTTNSDKTITRNARKFLIRDDSDNYFGSVGSNAALTPQSSVPANFFGINGGSSHNTAVEIQVQSGADPATYKFLECADSSGTIQAEILSDGTFNAQVKNFDIPHPTKDGYRLRHSVLEGPEAGVYIRGKVTGEGIIELPDYWTGLVHEDSISVQLTPIGSPCVHYVISQNISQVEIGCQCGEVNAYYNIYAERKDVDKVKLEYRKDK